MTPSQRPLAQRPLAKGWCPGAHRPMVAGDGLLLRVRPRRARLTLPQALGLCTLAGHFGSGVIDLTRRANLQVRGVAPRHHQAVVDALCDLDLLDADPAREALPALLVAPCWRLGDDTERVATALASRLGDFPRLPPKFGFAVDAGPSPVLGAYPADIRIERGRSGGLIVRADGAPAGRTVAPASVVDAALDLANWFATTAGPRHPPAHRMRARLAVDTLPGALGGTDPPAPPAACPTPGPSPLGPVYGVAFGQIDAAAWARLLRDSGATGLRLTPGRSFILEEGEPSDADGFVSAPEDPLLHVDACPGMPTCAAATVPTRPLARVLAQVLTRTARLAPGTLHVSGCAKGCARTRAAAITLVGRDGAFDLVRDGHAWDPPSRTGLRPHSGDIDACL